MTRAYAQNKYNIINNKKKSSNPPSVTFFDSFHFDMCKPFGTSSSILQAYSNMEIRAFVAQWENA